MPADDYIRNLMLEMGYRNGIKISEPDRNGAYIFKSDNKFELSIRVLEDKNQVLLFSCLYSGKLKESALYTELLSSNFLCLETQGATLAVDPKTGDIVLCRLLPAQEMDCIKLESSIGAFLNVADRWYNRLAIDPQPQQKKTEASRMPNQPNPGTFKSLA